tara:strand:+ start:652 stop:873 length:222 start_codon:yes stop_codon:yes gene_type:complete
MDPVKTKTQRCKKKLDNRKKKTNNKAKTSPQKHHHTRANTASVDPFLRMFYRNNARTRAGLWFVGTIELGLAL